MLKISSLDLGHPTLVLGAKPVSDDATSQGSGGQDNTNFAKFWNVLGQDESDIEKQQPDLDDAPLALVDEGEPVKSTLTPDRSLMPDENTQPTQNRADVQRHVRTTIDHTEKTEIQSNAALTHGQRGVVSSTSAAPPPFKHESVAPPEMSHDDLEKIDSITYKNAFFSGISIVPTGTKENAITPKSVVEPTQKRATTGQQQDLVASTALPSRSAENLPLPALRGEMEVEGQTTTRLQSEAQSSVPLQVQTGTHSPSTNSLPLLRDGAASMPHDPAETRIINQAQLPLAQTQAQLPLAQTQAQLPLAQTQAQLPLAQTQAQLPLAQTQAQLPLAQTQAQLPLAQTQAQLPLAQTQAQHPAARTEVQLSSTQTVGSSWKSARSESVAKIPNIALPPERRSTSKSMPRSAAVPLSSQIPTSPVPVSTVAQAADNRQFIAEPNATTVVEPLLSNLQTGTAPHASQSHAIPLAGAHAPKVAAQLAASALQIRSGTTQIMLNPEELGRVRMTLTTTEHGIAVAIAAERPETIDLMRRHVDLLVKEFEDLDRGDVAFSFGDNGPNSGETESKNTKENSTDHDVSTPDLATIPIRSAATSSGLDLKL